MCNAGGRYFGFFEANGTPVADITHTASCRLS
jgi:hypothetical protein